jgi:hypothetical protein
MGGGGRVSQSARAKKGETRQFAVSRDGSSLINGKLTFTGRLADKLAKNRTSATILKKAHFKLCYLCKKIYGGVA